MSVELKNNSDTYSPSFNIEKGEYEDIYTSTSKEFENNYKEGLMCCSGKIFLTRNKFLSHIKTQCHQKWLISFKSKNNDPIKKNIEFEKIIKSQQIIIQHQDNELFRLKLKLQEDYPNEIIYIIKDRESVRMDEKVFKVGITKRTFKERFNDYPPGSKPFLMYSVKNARELENKILESFNKKFKLVRGNEYFSGNLYEMIEEIAIIIYKYDKI